MDAVDQIYAAAAAPQIKVHSIGDDTLFRLSRAIRDVDRTAHEEGVGELIGPRLSVAKSIRFILCASPLQGASPHLRLTTAVRKLSLAEAELRSRSSERIVHLFSRIRPEIEAISRQESSALSEKFMSVWRTRNVGKNRFAIVVPDAKAKAPTDYWLHEIEDGANLKVLTPAALRTGDFYDELFLFGAPRWYIRNAGDFLFTTPRCARLSIFGYRWTDLKINTDPVFYRRPAAVNGSGGGMPESISPRHEIKAQVEESGTDLSVVESEPPFELPAVDVQAIMRSRRVSSSPIDAYEEEVEARLILLAGGDAVLLPYTDDARSFSADGAKDKCVLHFRALQCFRQDITQPAGLEHDASQLGIKRMRPVHFIVAPVTILDRLQQLQTDQFFQLLLHGTPGKFEPGDNLSTIHATSRWP